MDRWGDADLRLGHVHLDRIRSVVVLLRSQRSILMVMVNLVRRLMILAVIVLSPLYGLWILGGIAADARERHRHERYSRPGSPEVPAS